MVNGQSRRNFPPGIFAYHMHKPLTNRCLRVNEKQLMIDVYTRRNVITYWNVFENPTVTVALENVIWWKLYAIFTRLKFITELFLQQPLYFGLF